MTPTLVRRRFSLLVVAVTALVSLPARDARADADPALGYVFASYLTPVGGTWSGELIDGSFVTAAPTIGSRTASVFGLDNLSLGAGLGYDGMNLQLDFRTLPGSLTNTNPNDLVLSGALTFGWRLNFQFGNIEAWTRFGIGPLVAVSTAGLTPVGGIATNIEGGVDYFIVKEMLALGAKVWATPSYRFPLALSAVLDFAIGLRLCI